MFCGSANFSGRNQQKLGADDDYNMDENEAESETDKQAALHAGRGSPCLPSLHILLRAGTTAEIPHLPLQE